MSISIDKRHQLQAREIETHPAQAEYLIHYGQKSEVTLTNRNFHKSYTI